MDIDVRPVRPERDPRLLFSPRNWDMLCGLVGGKTNAQIARELHLAEKTVKNYMRDLYARIGARNRTEALLMALREGWVTVGDLRDGALEVDAAGIRWLGLVEAVS